MVLKNSAGRWSFASHDFYPITHNGRNKPEHRGFAVTHGFGILDRYTRFHLERWNASGFFGDGLLYDFDRVIDHLIDLHKRLTTWVVQVVNLLDLGQSG